MENFYEIKNHFSNDGVQEIVSMNGSWPGPVAKWVCSFERKGFGGNNGLDFKLEIAGGQIKEGKIEMVGEWERQAFIETLELILTELKRK